MVSSDAEVKCDVTETVCSNIQGRPETGTGTALFRVRCWRLSIQAFSSSSGSPITAMLVTVNFEYKIKLRMRYEFTG